MPLLRDTLALGHGCEPAHFIRREFKLAISARSLREPDIG
jgi:hypothetical protein